MDTYRNAITEINRNVLVTQHFGGIEKDKATRLALDHVPIAILSLKTSCLELKRAVDGRLPVQELLQSLIAAHDKYRKLALKYAQVEGVDNKSGVELEVLESLIGLIDGANIFCAREATSLIQEHGLHAIRLTAMVLEKKTIELSPICGSHPNGEGNVWTEGMAGNKSTWTFDDLIAHADTTLEQTTHGEEISLAIPLLKQAFDAPPQTETYMVGCLVPSRAFVCHNIFVLYEIPSSIVVKSKVVCFICVGIFTKLQCDRFLYIT